MPRLRLLLILFAAAAVVLIGSEWALAQATVSQWDFPPPTDANWRGPGFYLSWPKMLACWLVFVLWVTTADWVNRDLQAVRSLDYLVWNPIIVGTFLFVYLLTWMIPYFWVALPLLILAYAVPLGVFIHMRNQVVELHQRVMTRDHVRFLVASSLQKMGVKISLEAPDPHESGPPVKLRARGGPSERDEAARLGLARQTKGMRSAREIIAGGLICRATSIMLDFAQQSVAVRYMVDGLWLPREPEPRDKADLALETLKVLCGMNASDRQNRQEGPFFVEFRGVRLNGTVASQGTKTGERVVVQFEETATRFDKVDALGMREKMLEQLKETLEMQQGLFIFSALPASGLRTTTHLALRSMDRLMRDFVGIEEANGRYEAIENIPIETYSAEEKQSPADLLPRILRKEPNVLVIRDIPDAETLGILCSAATTGRYALTTMRSRDAAEALLRVLAIGVSPPEFAKAVVGVLNQRLIRKLCEKCKEAYQPTAEVLQQLGIPPGRISAFYRPPTHPDKPCLECGGVGYLGRTGIFELLLVGDTVRKALVGSPKLDLLRSAARKDGMRSMQEEGLLLVAKGVTSLPELMRVLKQ